MRTYCDQALSTLHIRETSVEALAYHDRGVKTKMSSSGGPLNAAGRVYAVNLAFTNDAEARPDGKADPYFLAFHTLEQAKHVDEMEQRQYAAGVKPWVVRFKSF